MSMTNDTNPHLDDAFRVNGSLWIEAAGERFFGPGPVQLLELIEETGSINQAARKMEMSYKKAWALVSNLNEKTGIAMVVTSTGGAKGGGSVLSVEAKTMIEYHKHMRERFRSFLAEETRQLDQQPWAHHAGHATS